MRLSQAIKPIRYFKSRAAEVIPQLNEQHSTMIITQNGEAKAVIIGKKLPDVKFKGEE